MAEKKNIVIVFKSVTYDAQEIIQEFTQKYGRFPIVSENGKKLKAAYENRKRKQNFDIKNL